MATDFEVTQKPKGRTLKHSVRIKVLTDKVGANFRCFGGGYYNPDNPISIALAENPLRFAAGVDVAEVIEFILKENKKLK